MAINAKLTAVGILCILALSSLMYYAASQLKLKKENSEQSSNDSLPKSTIDVAVSTATTSSGSVMKSSSDHDRIMKISSEYLELLRNSVTNRIFNDYKKIIDGSNMPPDANAASMAGIRRIDHYAALVAQAITDHIPGDIIETGVWRGGTVTIHSLPTRSHLEDFLLYSLYMNPSLTLPLLPLTISNISLWHCDRCILCCHESPRFVKRKEPNCIPM